MKFYKYHGAGNDFLLADNRKGTFSLDAAQVQRLCDRHFGFGADGLMLLEAGRDGYAFTMTYYNPDGSGGMMCGNGGRCIVAFAADLGLTDFRFLAADGPHEAEILEAEGAVKTIRLAMKDVTFVERLGENEFFLDTGTRHFVRFVDNPDALDLPSVAPPIRYDARFAPVGTNVNFVRWDGNVLHVRTWEKGVEGETLACGTGIVASALAAYLQEGLSCREIPVRARGGSLRVAFRPEEGYFRSVFLTGPAEFVGTVEISL